MKYECSINWFDCKTRLKRYEAAFSTNRYITRALALKIDEQPKKRKRWINNKRIIMFGGRDFETIPSGCANGSVALPSEASILCFSLLSKAQYLFSFESHTHKRKKNFNDSMCYYYYYYSFRSTASIQFGKIFPKDGIRFEHEIILQSRKHQLISKMKFYFNVQPYDTHSAIILTCIIYLFKEIETSNDDNSTWDLKQLSTRDKWHFAFNFEYSWVQSRFIWIKIPLELTMWKVKRIAVWMNQNAFQLIKTLESFR